MASSHVSANVEKHLGHGHNYPSIAPCPNDQVNLRLVALSPWTANLHLPPYGVAAVRPSSFRRAVPAEAGS